MKDYQTMLLMAIQPAPEIDEGFSAWYSDTHIPMLLECPSLAAAARYRVSPESPSEGPKYLAKYSCENEEAMRAYLGSEEVQASIRDSKRWFVDGRPNFRVKWDAHYELLSVHGAGEHNPDATLLFLGTKPPAGMDDRFNAWYDSAHIPLLLKCRPLRRAARYRLVPAAESKYTYPPYLAVYEFDNVQGYNAFSTSPDKVAASEEKKGTWLANDIEVVWRVLYEPVKSWSKAKT